MPEILFEIKKGYYLIVGQWIVFAITLFIVIGTIKAEVPDSMWFKGEPPVQLTLAAKIFVDAETKANPAGERSNRPLHVEHLEIPLKSLQTDSADGLDEKIRSALIFRRNNELYVRWILNPEDTQYNHELRKSLQERGIAYFEGTYFVGYLTASRSMIIQDPTSGVIFSTKSSTNNTGGNWKNKKETVRASQAARLVSDYISDNEKLHKNNDIGFIKEPLAFYDKISDQAMSVRQYDFFNDSSGKILVPLFSVFHENFGRDLALKAGTDNPEAYWFSVLGKKFGPFIVKLLLRYGMMLDSPHGQNFLLELRSDGVPTGVLFVRDFSDSRWFEPIVKTLGGKTVLDHYRKFEMESNSVSSSQMLIQLNPFFSGSIKFPSWIQDLSVWKDEFQKTSMNALRKMFSTNSKLKFQTVDSLYATKYWGWIVHGVNRDPLLENYIKMLKSKRKNISSPPANRLRCLSFY